MNNKKLRVLVLAGSLAAVAYAGYQFGLRQAHQTVSTGDVKAVSGNAAGAASAANKKP